MANFSMKLASTVSAAAIVASSMSASLVSAASEFLPYAEALASKGVINQTTETGYRLNDQITRAELAKVAANLGGYTKVECTGKVFTDVTASLGDLCVAIETLASAKVISTANPTFRPTANVTRAEMTKMLLGALSIAPVATGSHKFADVSSVLGDLEGFINAAADQGIVNKATNFRPNATGSRGEVFKIAARAAKLEVKTETTTTETKKEETATTGNISVTSVGSAVAQHVPYNASSVKVGTIEVKATGGDANLQSLVVTRSGLGDATDIESSNGIRAAIDGKIVSSNGYYNSASQQGIIYFTPALTLKNGESKKIDILVSLNTTAKINSQHQFSVTSVNTNAVSSPVTLGLVATTAYKAGNVNASLSNKASELKPGSKDQRVVSVRIQPTDRDVKVAGFSVARDNTLAAGVTRVSNDLTKTFTNVTVMQNGKAVGKATVTADKIFVTDLNVDVKVGTTATFDLRSDVLLDGVNNGVSLKIEDSSDVSAVEVSTGQITRVTPTTTVQTIKFANVTNSFTNVTTAKTTIAPGTDNAKFYDAKLTSSVPVIVKKITVTPDVVNPATINANFDTINPLYVRVNGLEVAQLTAADVVAGLNKIITTSFVVDADNSATVTIEGNVKEGAALGKLRFKVALTDVEDMSRNAATLQTTSRTGHDVEITGGTVNTYGSSTSNAINTIYENAIVDMGSISLQSRDQDIKVKKIAFKADTASTAALANLIDDVANPTDVEAVQVFMDGNEVSGNAIVSGNNIVFTFDSEQYISKETRKNFGLKLRTKSFAAAAYETTLRYVLDTANTEVYAQNVDSSNPANKITTLSEVALSGKTYTVGITSPTIVAVKKIEGNNIAQITVRNADSDKDIQVTGLKASITVRGKDANFASATASIKNGIDGVSVPATAGAVGGADFEFNTTTIKQVLTAPNGEQTFYVELPGVIADDIVVLTVKEITYQYEKAEGRQTIGTNLATNPETRSEIAK